MSDVTNNLKLQLNVVPRITPINNNNNNNPKNIKDDLLRSIGPKIIKLLIIKYLK